MAFDGTTIAAVRKELSDSILGGRIYKIAQPEPDELLITIKTPEGQRKLYISASASLPLIYLTDENKPSPMTAPGFCMLLRKYVGNGRITAISQPGLERILFFDIEHLNELGDLCRKRLIVEIMGKHSNLILTDETGKAVGVKAVGATGNEVTVNAKAVILATGGFGANLDMVAELVPALKGFMTTNAAGAQVICIDSYVNGGDKVTVGASKWRRRWARRRWIWIRFRFTRPCSLTPRR